MDPFSHYKRQEVENREIVPEVYKEYRKPEIEALDTGGYVVHDFMNEEEHAFKSKPDASDYAEECEIHWASKMRDICDIMGIVQDMHPDGSITVQDFSPIIYLLEHVHPEELLRVLRELYSKVSHNDDTLNIVREYAHHSENREGVLIAFEKKLAEHEACRSYTESLYEIFRQGAGDINLGLAASMVDEEPIIHDMVERFRKEAKPEKLKKKEDAQMPNEEGRVVV